MTCTIAQMADEFHRGGGWFDAWRAAYLGAREAAVTVAGLPLIRDAGRLGPIRYRRARSQTNTHSTRFDAPTGAPIADLPEQAAAIEPLDVIAIDYVAEGSSLLAAARGWQTRHRVAIDAMARVPLTDCRAEFARWLASRSKRDRRRWTRLERKLTEELGLRFMVADGAGGVDPLLAQLFAVEASGWKGRDGTAIRDDAADTLFYTRLARAAAAAGVLRIAMLRDGDRIAAFEYAIRSGDRLFVLKAAYEETYAAHSIGHVLAMAHIRHCCEDRAIAWYDVLGNGLTPAAHKLRFADRQELLYRIRVYGRGPRARLVRLSDDVRRLAKQLRDRRRALP